MTPKARRSRWRTCERSVVVWTQPQDPEGGNIFVWVSRFNLEQTRLLDSGRLLWYMIWLVPALDELDLVIRQSASADEQISQINHRRSKDSDAIRVQWEVRLSQWASFTQTSHYTSWIPAWMWSAILAIATGSNSRFVLLCLTVYFDSHHTCMNFPLMISAATNQKGSAWEYLIFSVAWDIPCSAMTYAVAVYHESIS